MPSIIERGRVLDRYGGPSGNYLAPKEVPYEQRALAPHSERANYYKYEVRKPFKGMEGEIAPWFDQPGGGNQLYGIDEFGNILSVKELVNKGYLKPIK
ncbi:TPA: TNT domain-containing protein [Clostridium botulinum]|nr:TNT domain-containing protein [Clostridium botulinum]